VRGDEDPVVYPRSDQELSALERLDALVAEQVGRLNERVRLIQGSPQVRQFVVAALRAARQARAAGAARPGEREQ
jgi:hypothetical protein